MNSSPERLFVAAGQAIYARGAEADRAYLVLGGKVELRLPNRAPQHRLVGEIFGDLALVDDSLRQATALAATDCELLAFTSAHLSDRIETADPLLRLVLGAIVSRYSETAECIRDHLGHAGNPRLREVWTAHSEAARDILSFEHELRAALARGEFDLYFQPIVRLSTGRLAGVEALVRWCHPTRGLLLPGDFIPFAEKTGMISDITNFCLHKVGQGFPALKTAALRNAKGVERLFVSVNVSGIDLAQSAFAARIVSTLCDAGVQPEDVKLEVTESILLADEAFSAQTLQNCRDQGFGIAIDDFGTGYSSLHALSILPISVLKMDRSFCRSLMAETSGRKIIGAILHLGRELGLSVIAEGVEVIAQRDLLRTMGCEFGQGFLFGPAVGHAEALALVSGWTPQPGEVAGLRTVSPAA